MPAYYNSPQANEQMSYSQGLIQQNFLTLQAYLQQDHSIITGNGKHKQVSLPVLGAAPASVAGEAVLYSKTVGAASELYMRRDGLAPEIPINGINGGTNAAGYTVLGGGLKLFYGEGVTNGAGTFNVNYAAGAIVGWPGFTNAASIQVTTDNSAAWQGKLCFMYVQQFGLGFFTVNSVNTTNAALTPAVRFTYLAVGI
jgi:hypothetical protein